MQEAFFGSGVSGSTPPGLRSRNAYFAVMQHIGHQSPGKSISFFLCRITVSRAVLLYESEYLLSVVANGTVGLELAGRDDTVGTAHY